MEMKNKQASNRQLSKLFWAPGLVVYLYCFAVPQVLAEELLLTLAPQPEIENTVSTRSLRSLSLSVSDGSSVSFARSDGRDFSLEARGGFFWTQVQQRPANAESMTLTPTRQTDASFSVLVDRAIKQGDRQQSFRTTIVAKPGEWTQLYGPAASGSADTQIYATTTSTVDRLYLKIESR